MTSQISSVIGTGRVVGGSAATTNGGFAVNGLGGDSSGFGVKSEEDEGEGEVALSREELRSVKLRNQASFRLFFSVAELSHEKKEKIYSKNVI